MFPSSLLSLAQAALAKMGAKKLRLATAESCTGGLIAGLLTEVPGASDVLDCGFVVYSDRAKFEMLGILPNLIAKHGAVSEAVARAMAKGALRKSGAQLSIAVTGIAGPGGGTELKPAGLVHISASRVGGPTLQEEHRFDDIGRSEVRLKSIEAALRLLLRLT